uniref:EGF-like domain-containing protein n=1 Tax=Monopterus albus TaxID=43700 RepID=A0A3Q3J4R8_MONAL
DPGQSGWSQPGIREAPLYIFNMSSFHGCIRNLYINHELQDFTRSHMKPGVLPGCQACRKFYCLHGICQPSAGPQCHCHSGWMGEHCDQCVKGVCMALDAQTYRCDCQDGYRGALCNLQGEPAALCQGLHCVHGQCQQTEEGEHCVCEQGYTGQSCDIGEEQQSGELSDSEHYQKQDPGLCVSVHRVPVSRRACRCRAGPEPGGAAASCCAPLRVRRRRLSFECNNGTSFMQDVEKPVECGCKECV